MRIPIFTVLQIAKTFATKLFGFAPWPLHNIVPVVPCSMSSNPELLSQETPQRTNRNLDPLFTLQVPLDALRGKKASALGSGGTRSSISSICFLPTQRQHNVWAVDAEESEVDDTFDDDDEPMFRCRAIALAEKNGDRRDVTQAQDAAATFSLDGCFLASSHSNGDSFLWDLGKRRIVSEFASPRGPGLVFRRMGQSQNVLYQTRDDGGTVSIHRVEVDSKQQKYGSSVQPSCPVVAEFQTNSRTFCAACPCNGNENIVALPSQDETLVTIRDVRVSEAASPVAEFQGDGTSDKRGSKRVHGMLTSLAMSEAGGISPSRPVVACGMESGSVFFHDLKMLGHPLEQENETSVEVDSDHDSYVIPHTCVKLGNNPVLGLDMASSSLPSSSVSAGSVVAVSGTAGDAADMSELPESERGTVAVIKAVLPTQQDGGLPVARLRARLPTCKVADNTITAGKPGVSVCRLRPDGRIFAIGGWDKRLRIFDRTGSSSPLAILKAHNESVTAVDWAPDAATSGILATGAGDGRICMWRCFASGKV